MLAILLETTVNSANSQRDKKKSNVCQSLFSLKNKFILGFLKRSIERKKTIA